MAQGVFEDITGKRFNRWTVIEKVGHDKWGALKWRCVCDCGTEKLVTSSLLRKGKSKSCGCLVKEIQSELRKGKPSYVRGEYGKSSFNMLKTRYKQRAKGKSIPYTLSDTDLERLFKSDCAYCGRSPSQVMTTKEVYGEYIYNGIDRLDSSLGYTPENTVACCKRCNQAKNNMSTEEFFNLVESIYEYSIKTGRMWTLL